MKKNIFIYLEVIYKETVFVITGIVGFILACVLPAIPALKEWNTLLIGGAIAGVSFLIANARAIIKLSNRNKVLKEEIARLKRITVDFDVNIFTTEFFYGEKEKYLDKEIKWAQQQLKDIGDIRNPNYAGSVNIEYLGLNLKNMLSPSEDKIKNYLEELQKLKEICNELKEYRFFNLTVGVKNIGNQYSEDIMARLRTEEGNYEHLYEMPLHDLQTMPDRPVGGFLPPLRNIMSSMPPFSTEKPVNRMFISSDKILKISIAKLHVQNEVMLSSETIFLQVKREIKNVSFAIEVVSSKSKSPQIISKTISL